MKIYIIASANQITDQEAEHIHTYITFFKDLDHDVFWPANDLEPTENYFESFSTKKQKLIESDEVHIFYDGKTNSIHFDLGMTFMTNKKIVVIDNALSLGNKNLATFLDQWKNSKH